MTITWVKYKKPDVSMTLNGALAGLVAITAGCDAVSPLGSFVIGIVAGIAIVVGVEFVDQKLKIDDPVGAVGVHCVCGSLGTLMVGLFSVDEGLLYGHGFRLLGVQLLGVLAVAAWVTVTMIIIFTIIKRTMGLRVEPEVEIQGLDKTEHALASAYADFMPVPAMSVLPAVNETINTVEDDLREKAYPSGQSREGAILTKVTILFNPIHLDKMKAAMNSIGVTGMTVTSVVGCGLQKGKTDYYRGIKIETLDLLPKVQMDIVVSAVPVDKVIDTASGVLHTGRIGDGKIFVSHVQDAVKISTGERGYAAMQGTDV
jgi:Amt family ammonium transporter